MLLLIPTWDILMGDEDDDDDDVLCAALNVDMLVNASL
jgi:hypothetical protein